LPPDRFQPPIRRSDVLPRPHLVKALAAHIDRKLQLVVAPAGFGKSSLLVEFVHETEFASCWISLTPADADLADFIPRLCLALRGRFLAFGERTLAAVRGSIDVERSSSALVRSLVADVEDAIDEPVLLVLDDFQVVNESAPVTRFLGELLRVMPDTLCIVISSRAMPNLPLPRLMVEEELHSLGAADLQFTADEFQALLRLRGLDDVPPERVAELAGRFEGWITGLLLAIARLRTSLGGRAFETGDSVSLVYDYLADEVFEHQPADLQRFLLISSVPVTADPEICRVLIGPGDWEEMARTAAATGLFVVLTDDGRGAFRFHQLFRDFLQARLRRLAPDDFRRLHRLAGEHLAEQGEWQAALSHFREADAMAEIVRLVAHVVPQLEGQFRWRAVHDAVQGLSLDHLRGHPQVLLAAAWAAQRLEDFPRAIALAEAAREIGAGDGDAGIEARALARLGMIHNVQGRMQQAMALLDQARALAPDDGELVATVRFYLGQVLGATGNLAGAEAEFRAALVYFDESGPAMRAADAEHALALALDYAGQLAEAAARYQSAHDRWARLGITEPAAYELCALGVVQSRRGEYESATTNLNAALQSARLGGTARTEADAQCALGGIWLAVGQPQAAAAAFESGLEVAREFDELRPQILLLDGLALACALQHDTSRAEMHAHRAVSLAQRRDQRLLAAIASLTLGAVQARAGRPGALATLEQASRALTDMQAGWQMARAQTWLAQARFRLGNESAAFDHLRSALDLARAYDTDAVFDLHVRWDPGLFEAAHAAGIQPDRIRAILARGDVAAPAPPVQGRPHAVEVRGFGPGTAVVEGGGAVVWKRDKSRELLFLLLQHGPQRYDQLTEALWPESHPAKAHAILHMAVSDLRRAVDARIVVRASGMYQVNEQLLTRYDVAEFEWLLQQATAVVDEDAIPLLRQAVDLYTSPFLGDTSAEWSEIERERLERLYLGALTRLADLYDATGQHHESIAAAECLLQTDPYREDAHARIIRANLRIGNRAAAVRHFERCARLLRDDLGVAPGPELAALFPSRRR
jgi:ATP/maltotriose-dependent transcriptional regulator MalT/DNA-binding SARP family transcriptional activator